MSAVPDSPSTDLPLNNEWSVWTNMRGSSGQSKEGWESSLIQLGSFSTINKYAERHPLASRFAAEV